MAAGFRRFRYFLLVEDTFYNLKPIKRKTIEKYIHCIGQKQVRRLKGVVEDLLEVK